LAAPTAFLSSMGFGFVVRMVDEASGNLNTITKELNKTSAATQGMLGGIAALQTQLKVGIGAMIGGLAISGPLIAAANASGRFEFVLKTVQAITQSTTAQLDQLRIKALEIAMITMYTPQQIVEGMRNLSTMGFTVVQIMDMIKDVSYLAQASFGQLNVALAGEVVGGALRSFGLGANQASKIVDILTRATQLTNLQARDFQYVMGLAGPAARIAGQDVVELITVMGMLRNTNLQASMSATAFANSIRAITTATGQAKIRELGVELGELNKKTGVVEFRKLGDIVIDVAEKIVKYKHEVKAAQIANEIFGERGKRAAAAIMNQTITLNTAMTDWKDVVFKGGGAIKALRNELYNATGTAEGFNETLLPTFHRIKELIGGAHSAIVALIGDPVQKLLASILYIYFKFLGLINEMLLILGPVKDLLINITFLTGAFLTLGGAIAACAAALKLFNRWLIASIGTEVARKATVFANLWSWIAGNVKIAADAMRKMSTMGAIMNLVGLGAPIRSEGAATAIMGANLAAQYKMQEKMSQTFFGRLQLFGGKVGNFFKVKFISIFNIFKNLGTILLSPFKLISSAIGGIFKFTGLLLPILGKLLIVGLVIQGIFTSINFLVRTLTGVTLVDLVKRFKEIISVTLAFKDLLSGKTLAESFKVILPKELVKRFQDLGFTKVHIEAIGRALLIWNTVMDRLSTKFEFFKTLKTILVGGESNAEAMAKATEKMVNGIVNAITSLAKMIGWIASVFEGWRKGGILQLSPGKVGAKSLGIYDFVYEEQEAFKKHVTKMVSKSPMGDVFSMSGMGYTEATMLSDLSKSLKGREEIEINSEGINQTNKRLDNVIKSVRDLEKTLKEKETNFNVSSSIDSEGITKTVIEKSSDEIKRTGSPSPGFMTTINTTTGY